MKKLLKFLLGYSPGMVILTGLASILTGLANTGLIAMIHRASSNFLDPPGWVILGFIGVCLLYPLARIGASILIANLIQTAIFDIRLNLCRKILRAPLRSLEEVGPNRLLASLTGDVIVISGSLLQLPLLGMNLTLFISCITYLFWLHWGAGLGVLCTTILGLIGFNIIAANATRYFHKARSEQDKLFKHFRAITDGSKEFKLHRERRDEFYTDMLQGTAASMRSNNISAASRIAAAGSIGHILFFIAIGFSIFLLPRMAADVTQDVVLGYSFVLLYMVVPLDGLTQVAPVFKNAVISLNKIEALGVNLNKETVEEQDTFTVPAEWHEISYQGLTHTFHREKEDSMFTMGPMDLSFRPGELVFLVGGNGSGKTTLAKLLTGLYTPESGKVILDGKEITDENRDAFRQLFTGVFSDFFLFETMVGLDTENKEDVIKDYLVKLQLNHKVQFTDGELSTVDLSTGQRKRLALLTAYLEDRPIFMFDEWASDQDPLFKNLFYRVLLPELQQRGKTVLVITHDDHYFDQADRILKLDYGQLEYDKPVAS